MRPARGWWSGMVLASPAVLLFGLAPLAVRGGEPGPLGRFFRFGGLGASPAAAASPREAPPAPTADGFRDPLPAPPPGAVPA